VAQAPVPAEQQVAVVEVGDQGLLLMHCLQICLPEVKKRA
jgi:hypothetical protein